MYIIRIAFAGMRRLTEDFKTIIRMAETQDKITG